MTSLGYQINNPGNLRWSASNNWEGQTGNHSGFCQFDTMDHGIRANLKNIHSLWESRPTPRMIIEAYAPDSENDTEAYIANHCKMTGWEDNEIIDLSKPDNLARFGRATFTIEIGADAMQITDAQIMQEALEALA